MSFCVVLFTCESCGNGIEVYGPFNTVEAAKEFKDWDSKSQIGMSCITKKIVEMNKRTFDNG